MFLSIAGQSRHFFVLSSMLLFWTFVPAFAQISEVHTFKNVRMGGGDWYRGSNTASPSKTWFMPGPTWAAPTAGTRLLRNGYPSPSLRETIRPTIWGC